MISHHIDRTELLLCEEDTCQRPIIRYQVLCKTPLFTKATNVDVRLHGFALSSTATVAKRPLRLIAARTPIVSDLYHDDNFTLTSFLDTLECGHQQWTPAIDVPDVGKKRHRCGPCAEAAAPVAVKKPAHSVRIAPKKTGAA